MKQESKPLLGSSTIGAVIFACVTVAGLIAYKFATLPGMTQLHLNNYAFISIISAVGTLVILLRIIAGRSRTEETSWFILVMLGQVLYAGGEAMQRLTTDRQAAIFWAQIGGAGASLLGISVLLFAMAYVRGAQAKPAILAPILVWASVVVTLFYTEGSLIFNNDPAQLMSYPWGYNNATGHAFWLALTWIMLPGITAGILLLLFRRRSDNPLLRKQAFLFALAVLVPLLAGLVTAGVLPILNISIPPLATLFELVTCVLIYYGISQYQFFKINPAVLAENVLTTMNEAVVVTRSDFTVEYVNSKAQDLLQLSHKDLSHTSIHSLFSPDSWPKIHAYIEGQKELEEDFDGITLVDQSGKHTPVRVFISNMQEGTFHAYVFVISDISDIVESYQRLENDSVRIRHLLDEARRLEEQLKAEKANVEHVVDVRTKELQEAQVKLKETDKLKTEFIMLGSHNLRTPITIMASSVEMLKTTQNEDQRRTFIDSLEKGVKRLKDFVEDMVTIVSLEGGSGQKREQILVSDLLNPVITETNALATTKAEVEFKTDIRDDQSNLSVNSLWLRGALRNLLNNAFKFTTAGNVTLSAHLTDQGYDISITDTGIGISAEELPKIFTKFHRGTDIYAYDYEGRGIGLYLTKLIVEQQGGTIRVESAQGRGSTFTVSLPILKTT